MKKNVIKVSRERAIELTINHNGVTREIAETYSDSELKEVIKHVCAGARTFVLKADF